MIETSQLSMLADIPAEPTIWEIHNYSPELGGRTNRLQHLVDYGNSFAN